MEVRVSRIISEYHEYTRKEAEDLIREGRVKVNGALSGIEGKSPGKYKYRLNYYTDVLS